ncbi:MAG: hypothetical protein JKX73_09545 [Flavobacteriales bacterium]|nr:hypothetical protein [Flavobacteriales bacterium]
MQCSYKYLVVIALLITTGCEKEVPSTSVNTSESSTQALLEPQAKKIQNEFTVEEFEHELNVRLNDIGTNLKPTDKGYIDRKNVEVIIPDLEVHIQLDGSGKIMRKELERVRKKIRDKVHNEAKNHFTPSEKRVLAFAFLERIKVPVAAAGTIKLVLIKVTGLIGQVSKVKGPCFNQVYVW